MDIFDLSAKITLDSKEFESGVSSAGNSMDGLSAKAVALGNAIYDIGSKAVSAFGQLAQAALGGYADFEQLTGGIDTLFKTSSETVQSYADNAYKTAGLSANAYMETATSFAGALLQSLGQDTEAAAYADRAITDMSDNANKMGTSMESIIATYQSLSRGNYAMLDNLKLGYGGTKAELERLLEDADALSESFNLMYDANGKVSYSFADIIDAISIVQSEMGITGTTAAEAASTISGSVASMKAAWENWLVGLGDPNADLSGLTDNLIDSVQTMASNVLPVMGQIKDSLVEVFSDLTGINLSGISSQMQELSGGIMNVINPLINAAQEGGFSGLFDELLNQFENLTGLDLSAFTGTIQTVMAALDGLREDGASGALEAIVGKFEELTGLDLSAVKEQLGNFGQAIDDIANAFTEGGVQGAIDEFLGKLDELTGVDVSGFFGGIVDSVKELAQAFNEGGLSKAAEELANSFKDAGPRILEFGQGILDSIGQLLSQIGEQIYSAMPENIQGLIDSIGNFFRSLWDYLKVLWEQLQPFVAFFAVTLVEGIKQAWENIKNAFDFVVETVTAAFDFISAQLDFAVALWKGDFEGAADAIKRSWDAVLDFFYGIIENIKSAFSGLVSFFSNIGSQMWNGLKSGFSAAVDGIKDIASDIGQGFKDFFGIKSPSRLFAQYGSFMAQGLEKGWDSEIDSVVDRMSRGVTVHGSVDFASSAIGKASSAQISSMLTGMQERGGTYSINLVVDGRTLANVVFDPLSGVAKQKGVTLGA